ncbi:MAG: chemotaxis protein CheW [Candidatus Gastranaerophilales bacterium]|nr:chemotaxis protein CheW [Candidatus Gastranaerophilales bacterium]
MEKDLLNGGKTSEVEMLEFKTGGNSYGINISDIREILSYDVKPTPVPNSHPFIEGIIMPRDFLISIIDLKKYLKLNDVDEMKNEMLIVTGINNLNIAIHVDSVNGIHTKLITDITKPGKKLSTTQKDVITGIFDNEGRNIEIIDLRKVFQNINPEVNVG